MNAELPKGDPAARRVLRALKNLSTQLSGAQVGIMVTNLGIGLLAEPAVAGLLRGPLLDAGLDRRAVSPVAVTVAVVVATGATMVYGELVPKNLAIAKSMSTARAVVGFQLASARSQPWPIRILNGSATALLRAVGVEPQEELASAWSSPELLSLVKRSADQGTLPAQTALLLQRSLTFGSLRAGDVITARVRMHTVQQEDLGSRGSSAGQDQRALALSGSRSGQRRRRRGRAHQARRRRRRRAARHRASA